MKSCRDFTDLFIEMHENRADAATRQSFAEHMQACPDCREDFKWYGATVQALNTMERAQPPREFMVQLGARLDKLDSPSLFDYFRTFFSPGSAIPIPVGVTALLAIAVTGVLLYNQSTTFLPWGYQHTAVRSDTGPTTAARTATPGGAASQAKALPSPDHTAPSTLVAVNPPSTLRPHTPAQSTPVTVGSHGVTPYPPTLADRIGADNLTVESASIDNVVETVKRILPNLQGRIVEMRPNDRAREVLMGVTIPSQAYHDLTSSLVTHGALQAGAGSGVTPPKQTDGKQVFLYIRIQNPR